MRSGRHTRYAAVMSKATPLLRLLDCTVVRDGRAILHVDDLTLNAGEHVAILGPNGAGKSTLIRLLTRDVRPLAHDDGSPAVVLLGRERWAIADARKVMGVVSDALQEDYIVAVSARDTVTSGYFGSIGLYRHQHVTSEMLSRTDELLELLGIAHLADRTMDTLSTGEARRALIARALVHDPAVLVLDEPAAGLDPTAAWQLRASMRGLAQGGRTLVLVTHHVEDIVRQIDRVVLMRDARIIADGPKRELLTSSALSALFDGVFDVEERDGEYRLW